MKLSPTMALAILLLLILTCALAVTGTIFVRMVAVEELEEKRAFQAQLQNRVRSHVDRNAPSNTIMAPASAFVEAPTQGLAGAQLQAYLSQLVAAERGTLISAGAQPPRGADEGVDLIHLLATMDISYLSLQTMLHRLETSVPYVFVDALSVQLRGATTQLAEDPVLRATLTVRALWRRPHA
jgi:hypothetical protein